MLCGTRRSVEVVSYPANQNRQAAPPPRAVLGSMRTYPGPFPGMELSFYFSGGFDPILVYDVPMPPSRPSIDSTTRLLLCFLNSWLPGPFFLPGWKRRSRLGWRGVPPHSRRISEPPTSSSRYYRYIRRSGCFETELFHVFIVHADSETDALGGGSHDPAGRSSRRRRPRPASRGGPATHSLQRAVWAGTINHTR